MLLNLFKKSYGAFNLVETHKLGDDYVKEHELKTLIKILKKDSKQAKAAKLNKSVSGSTSFHSSKTIGTTLEDSIKRKDNIYNPLSTMLFALMAYRVWKAYTVDHFKRQVKFRKIVFSPFFSHLLSYLGLDQKAVQKKTQERFL